jgi:hypothetical protein
MAICLGDDGTLDTVLYCDECREEFRFSYGSYGGHFFELCSHGGLMDGCPRCYDEWVDDCVIAVQDEHECPDSSEATT